MKLCTEPGCAKRTHARGMCATHYQRWSRYGRTVLRPNSTQTCMAAGCELNIDSYGLCNVHYQRMKKHGRIEGPSLIERIVARYEVDADGCWIWQGKPDAAGYGRISVADNVQYAHRVSFETFIGPIPEGLTIDHLCRVRACINPGHMEPVTLSENVRRELAVRYGS